VPLGHVGLSCLEIKYDDLELHYNTVWKSTSTNFKATDDSNVSTTNGCKLKVDEQEMNA
jgi:hypothetical protein